MKRTDTNDDISLANYSLEKRTPAMCSNDLSKFILEMQHIEFSK